MRWFLWSTVLMGCGGTGDAAPDATFKVTVTNVKADCEAGAPLVLALDEIWPLAQGEVDGYCPCTDINDEDCGDVVDRSSETFSYEYHRDGDHISMRIDGEDFATDTIGETTDDEWDADCGINYETPVWLDSPKGGDVQWQITGSVLIDPNGGCKSVFGEGDAKSYDFLGIERVEIMGGENPDYPIGRIAWKIISGKRTSG
jgi:hypothetical protein